jgi:hypothetical protein
MRSLCLITRIRGFFEAARREPEDEGGHHDWLLHLARYPKTRPAGKSAGVPPAGSSDDQCVPCTGRGLQQRLFGSGLLTCIHLLLATIAAQADSRTSANYSLSADTIAAGGGQVSSVNYGIVCSIGLAAGVSGSTSPVMNGVTGLSLTATTSSLDEGTTVQLAAWAELDDGTLLEIPASGVLWSVQGGPLTGVDGGGIAVAGRVYQDTQATVQGSYLGKTGVIGLTVVNVKPDDFASYAGDGIDDAWQVRYFGQPPNANAGPDVDFAGTGQTNLFKYIAGLNPLDRSRFSLSIEPVPADPGRKNLIFGPIAAGRSYVVTSSPDLPGGTFTPLSHPSPHIDNGNQRTITDLDASGSRKFYRVEIVKP